jgi:LuxR family maltose regulon positive regulatory protein
LIGSQPARIPPVQTQLLRTKLYVPPVHPHLVPRPRLTAQLDRGVQLGRRLALLSAPAGYGKTTLLAEWIAGAGLPVAWLSLDEDDNAPARFWSYLIAALQTVHPDLGAAARASLDPSQSRPPPIEPLLTGLINELDRLPAHLLLVLDDYHAVTAPEVHRSVEFLLTHRPAPLHLVIATRADPPWPLARLRARGDLTELRLVDLVFTPDEIAAFLESTAGLRLPPDQLAALGARTEGWPAGLQLAALSLTGRDPRATADFIHSLAGSHRFILDYLLEEVLDRQPTPMRDFLLTTSILDRFAAPLCDAVTGRDDGLAILRQLEQANLFLIPLDDRRRWFRYHHLFAGLLRGHLRQTRPDRVPTLHHRASAWYERNGWVALALSHALAAGDLLRAERIVRENVLALMDRGELGTLAGRLEALPLDAVHSRPWLCLALAWTRVYTGPLDGVEPLLRAAEAALTDLAGPPAEASHIRGHIATVRAYAAVLLDDRSRVASLARAALRDLPTSDLMTRGVALAVLATALRDAGDLGAAEETLLEAVAVSRGTRNNHVTVTNLCDLAEIQTARGALHRAAATCRQALELAHDRDRPNRRRLPIAGLACAFLSHVLREWNDLESALHYAEQGVILTGAWGWAEIMMRVHVALARARGAAGDTTGALEALAEARTAAAELGPDYSAGLAALEARIHLSAGDLAPAARWAAGYAATPGPADGPLLPRFNRHLLWARILLAQGEVDRASDLLAWLLDQAEAAGVARLQILATIVQALVLQARGQGDAALAALASALSLAEPENYVRSFTTAGEPMGGLLRRAIAQGVAVPYATRLLAALHEDAARRVAVPSAPAIELLTRRELEVLRLLTTHLSGTEIARQLTISPNTVRTHIKNIYAKLDAHSRDEAVARAEELALL